MSDTHGDTRPAVTSVKIKKKGPPGPQENDYEVEFTTSNAYPSYIKHIANDFIIHINGTAKVTFGTDVVHSQGGEHLFKCDRPSSHVNLAALYNETGETVTLEYANGDTFNIPISREQL